VQCKSTDFGPGLCAGAAVQVNIWITICVTYQTISPVSLRSANLIKTLVTKWRDTTEWDKDLAEEHNNKISLTIFARKMSFSK